MLNKVISLQDPKKEVANQEIEKKYLLSRLPEVVKAKNKATKIEQTYLDHLNDITVLLVIQELFGKLDLQAIAETRIRRKVKGNGSVKCLFTCKSDGTLSREEYEKEIPQEVFNKLLECQSLGKVNKVRYEDDIEIDGEKLVVEVDVYHDNLEGLFSAEIEIPAKFIKKDLQKLLLERYGDNTIKDVTEDKSYKNKNLAKLKRWPS